MNDQQTTQAMEKELNAHKWHYEKMGDNTFQRHCKSCGLTQRRTMAQDWPELEDCKRTHPPTMPNMTNIGGWALAAEMAAQAVGKGLHGIVWDKFISPELPPFGTPPGMKEMPESVTVTALMTRIKELEEGLSKAHIELTGANKMVDELRKDIQQYRREREALIKLKDHYKLMLRAREAMANMNTEDVEALKEYFSCTLMGMHVASCEMPFK